MWDGGVLVQRSPSLAALHPAFVLALHPEDLASVAGDGTGKVRVSTRRGSLVVVAVADAGVAPGTAVLPFNLPDGGASALIDASAPYTELSIEPAP
jgi:formate dehydrogenase major subunit